VRYPRAGLHRFYFRAFCGQMGSEFTGGGWPHTLN
jgi:hypothetical protein